jgi:ACS family tartrate transporter-like MFS transporter
MPNSVAVDADKLRRKIAWRVLPLIFIIYIVAYLDRANVGFAKLRMADDLKFSESVFGIGLGIFFIGYLILEIPGALLVERWSARKWFARILISWGIVSALTAFVTTPTQFYVARFMLGVAEAGFFPGIIVYFTHWFTGRDRGRALSGLVMAVPFSLAMGAAVSGQLLKVQWFGLAGWKWLFIVEGLPAVLLGFAALFMLDDRPRDAKWLTADERDWLTTQLDAEAKLKTSGHGESLMNVLKVRNVWMLALGIFATNTGGYALSFWLPTVVESVAGKASGQSLALSGMIYAFGIIGVFLSGQSSDRTGDRKWHCIAGQVGTALFLALSAIPGQPIWLVMFWLSCTGFMAFTWPTPFWALPTVTLTASAAAVSIGFINMSANLAGALGNYNVGWIRSHGFGDSGTLFFLAGCYLIGSFFVAMVTVKVQPKFAAWAEVKDQSR